MVVISVSVCTKQGKLLFARQYVEMSKLRVENLLDKFLQLIKNNSYQEKQHTYCDTNDVRYIYKSFEEVYLLMITDKQSNIFNHLNALQTIAKCILPKDCQHIND
eukprot:377344_1